jgi:endonuclease-3
MREAWRSSTFRHRGIAACVPPNGARAIRRYDPLVPRAPKPAAGGADLVPAPAVLERLLRHFPAPDTELAYRNAFELLVATVLSAQSTDARVNETTPALFARYPDARALAAADPDEVEPLVHATGFFRVKARAIITLSQRLVADHGGEVPADMDALTALPGVGRKTANVVLGHALGVPGLPVDRHVLRVTERIGLTHETTPEGVERDLCAALPPSDWTRMSDGLILLGRRVCRPKPQCGACEVADVCRYPFKAGGLQPLDLDAPVRKRSPGKTTDRRTSPTATNPSTNRRASATATKGGPVVPPRPTAKAAGRTTKAVRGKGPAR